jgi:ligand-binding SRPBCC domain-containing protein
MPVLEFEITLAAPLDVIWAYHNDVNNLPALSPGYAQVTIESADVPLKQGSRIVITAKAPLGRRLRWVAQIIEHKPPRAVVFGEEARFVDVQKSGPLRAWRHEHDFEHISEKATRVLDHVSYRFGWGPIGWLADVLFFRRYLRSMLLYRHAILRVRFGVVDST